MTIGASYACIGIVDWQLHGVAVETISIHEGVCALSGAWYLNKPAIQDVSQLVRGALVLEIGATPPTDLKSDPKIKFVDVASFLRSAKAECTTALQEYSSFKAEKLVKRKKLVEPDFTRWPDSLDLEKASHHLVQLGRAASINGTDPEMERVLNASRLVKWMIDGWLRDEQERNQRSYMSASKPDIRILPASWLQVLQTAR